MGGVFFFFSFSISHAMTDLIIGSFFNYFFIFFFIYSLYFPIISFSIITDTCVL